MSSLVESAFLWGRNAASDGEAGEEAFAKFRKEGEEVILARWNSGGYGILFGAVARDIIAHGLYCVSTHVTHHTYIRAQDVMVELQRLTARHLL